MAQWIAAATAGANLDAPLKLLESPMPRPPAGWSGSGSVVVRFTIEANGQVSTLHVLGDPPPILADVTRRAVERWRFAPITKGGAPTSIQVQQQFAFSSSS
ncbi:hypothetical protein ISF6_5011 [Piscinibacter sakaiensis]|uniref:TonB C-terminal domain-containing protein n=2 Tax=Piscinibacter sakaiensis TaxID=1547922 RepID=A0A0K8P7B4_PISS1|nr:hypothetical protein ISF6_5011 [Piscinibacter sakaiensis]